MVKAHPTVQRRSKLPRFTADPATLDAVANTPKSKDAFASQAPDALRGTTSTAKDVLHVELLKVRPRTHNQPLGLAFAAAGATSGHNVIGSQAARAPAEAREALTQR